MKIALVRGPSLNPWEMQNFEQLGGRHKLLAIGSRVGAYQTSEIDLPVRKLWCAGEVFSFIPSGIHFLYKVLGDPQYLFGFDKAVSVFDIVHSAEIGNYYSLQAVRAKDKRLVKKVALTVWETIAFLGNDNPVRLRNKKEVIEKTDVFLAVTKFAKEALIKEGVDQKKVEIVPMGVNLNRFKNKDSRFKNKKKIILFVGRLAKEKGIYVLLKALAAIKNRDDWGAIIVGDGPERENFKFQISNFKLEHQVKVIPGTTYDKMPAIYNLSDILVLPSIKTADWEEQFGMVLVEAMACGKAVVTTSGAPSKVVGEVGVLVAEEDPQALGKALANLLDNDQERTIRAKKGRERVERLFDANKISKKIEALYERVLR